MKKIMIALAAVAMAVSANAMSVKWKVLGSKTGTPSYTVYLMAGSASSWTSAAAVQKEALASGTMAAAGREYNFVGTTKSDKLSKTDNFYLICIAADSKTYAISGNYYGGSYVYNESAEPPEAAPATAEWNAAAAQFSEWKEEPEPTPEPTSAMLMLLGVAGLALRRKQK